MVGGGPVVRSGGSLLDLGAKGWDSRYCRPIGQWKPSRRVVAPWMYLTIAKRRCETQRDGRSIPRTDRSLLGWDAGSTPVGGTGRVRPGDRGDRRRSGGNADRAVAGHDARPCPRNRRPRSAVDGQVGRRTSGNWSLGGSAKQKQAKPNRERCRSAVSGGIEGGRQHPSPAAVFNTACAGLSTVTVVQASPAEPPKAPLRASPGTASTGPSRANSPASPVMAALSAAHRFRPTFYPSGTGDRASGAMEWTPPPGGIAMCHDGTEAIATLRGLTITGRRHPHGRG